eukprot:21972-Chlamydomonas_euryale.AAC.3
MSTGTSMSLRPTSTLHLQPPSTSTPYLQPPYNQHPQLRPPSTSAPYLQPPFTSTPYLQPPHNQHSSSAASVQPAPLICSPRPPAPLTCSGVFHGCPPPRGPGSRQLSPLDVLLQYWSVVCAAHVPGVACTRHIAATQQPCMQKPRRSHGAAMKHHACSNHAAAMQQPRSSHATGVHAASTWRPCKMRARATS